MGRTHNFLKSHLLARHACSVPSDVAERPTNFYFLQSSTEIAKSLQFMGVSGNRLTLTVRPSFTVILSFHLLLLFMASSFFTAGKLYLVGMLELFEK